MSIFTDASCIVILADYIGIDAASKANILGGGFAISGLQQNGQTAPQYVAVFVDVPGKYRGEEFTLSLELHDDTAGGTVQMPGPSGQVEALRVAQIVKAEAPNIPGIYLPDTMFSRVQTVLAFPNGIPLPVGHFYSWRAQIDGQGRPGWKASFHVPGPPPQPVFGGPAGPAAIPTMPSPE